MTQDLQSDLTYLFGFRSYQFFRQDRYKKRNNRADLGIFTISDQVVQIENEERKKPRYGEFYLLSTFQIKLMYLAITS